MELAAVPVSVPLDVVDLGRIRYTDAFKLQSDIQKELIAGTGTETLLLCEHDPVITIGTSGGEEHLRTTAEALNEDGIDLVHTNRGGKITFHGPGQLVAYPLLDLRKRRRDVDWYMRSLEEAIIRTLQDFGITGVRIPGMTGVWTKPPENAIDFPRRKLASIGVRLSRWCTLHGLSINVEPCRQGFNVIDPCGYKDIDVSSMIEEHQRKSEENTIEIKMSAVKQRLTLSLADVFGMIPNWRKV